MNGLSTIWKYEKPDGVKTDLIKEGFVPAGKPVKLANLNGHGYWYPQTPTVSLPAGLESEYAAYYGRLYPESAVADHVNTLRAGGDVVYQVRSGDVVSWVVNPVERDWIQVTGDDRAELVTRILQTAWDPATGSVLGSGARSVSTDPTVAARSQTKVSLVESALSEMEIIAGPPLFTKFVAGSPLELDLPRHAAFVFVSVGVNVGSSGDSPVHFAVYSRGRSNLALSSVHVSGIAGPTLSALNVGETFNVRCTVELHEYALAGPSSNPEAYFGTVDMIVPGVVTGTAQAKVPVVNWHLAPTSVTPPQIYGGHTFTIERMNSLFAAWPESQELLMRGTSVPVGNAAVLVRATENLSTARRFGLALSAFGRVLGLSRASMTHGFTDVVDNGSMFVAQRYSSVVSSIAVATALELAASKRSLPPPASVADLRVNVRNFYGWVSASSEYWPNSPLYSTGVWDKAREADQDLGGEIFVPADDDVEGSKPLTFLQVNVKSNNFRAKGALNSLVLPGDSRLDRNLPRYARLFVASAETWETFADEALTVPVDASSIMASIVGKAQLVYTGGAALPTGSPAGAYPYWYDVFTNHHLGANYGSVTVNSLSSGSDVTWSSQRCLDRFGLFKGPAGLTPEYAMACAAGESWRATETFRGLCCVPFGLAAYAVTDRP